MAGGAGAVTAAIAEHGRKLVVQRELHQVVTQRGLNLVSFSVVLDESNFWHMNWPFELNKGCWQKPARFCQKHSAAHASCVTFAKLMARL
jgi:hypothetical protein